MRPSLLVAAAFTGTLLLSTSASATYQTFFGEDLNDDRYYALPAVPHSSDAEDDFKSKLSSNIYTENFESQTAGVYATLELSFLNLTTSVITKATLTGGGGSVAAVTPGTTNGQGRYSIPSASSSKFWDVDAGAAFEIKFDRAIAGFGFYGIDIGDYGGAVSVTMLDKNGDMLETLNVPATEGSKGDTDGSVIYFAALSQGTASDFWGVRFSTTYGDADYFGFDNFTIATRDQVNPPTNPTPIPGTLLLAGLGLAGLGAMRRRAR